MPGALTKLLGLDKIGRAIEGVRVFGGGGRATVILELDDLSTIYLDPIVSVASTTKLFDRDGDADGRDAGAQGPDVSRAPAPTHDLGVLQPTVGLEDHARDLGVRYLSDEPVQTAPDGDQPEHWSVFSLLRRAREHNSQLPRFVIENPETGLRSVRVGWFRSYVRSEVGTDAERIVRAMPTLGWTKPGGTERKSPEGPIKATDKVGGGTIQGACFVVPRSWA
jgi:hypothetical protein